MKELLNFYGKLNYFILHIKVISIFDPTGQRLSISTDLLHCKSYPMNKLFFILIIFFILPHIQNAQCSIRDLTLSVAECNENQFFDVEINFIHSESSDSFLIRGNGNNYGIFAYADLPIKLQELPGGCSVNYEFEVRDIVSDNCRAAQDLGMICCNEECNIKITGTDFIFCEDSGIDFLLNVERSGTLQSGFDVFSGNNFVGYFQYEDLPVLVENFPSGNTATETIIVCNNDQPDCCDTLIVETPCGCAFLDKSVRVIDCNLDDKTFYVTIDFIPQMLSDSFFLGGNNTSYGTFGYTELPITLGPLPFSDSKQYEFVFLDRISTFCFDFIELGIVNNCEFPCLIENVRAEISDCMDKTFIAEITFKSSGVIADSFSIRGNGQLYGRFEYGQDSYQIGPLSGDCETIYEFVVIDDNDESCRAFTGLQKAICCTLPCPLNAIQTEINCLEKTLIINIDTNDSGDADSVYVYINEDISFAIGYDEFPYAYRISESLSFPLNIKAVDPYNDECVLEITQAYTCDFCEIGGMKVEILGCDDTNTNIIINIDFAHTQNPDSTFNVYVYADLVGTYKYKELPITLFPIPNPNFEMQVTVTDNSDQGCRQAQVVNAYTCSTALEYLKELEITFFQTNNHLIIDDPKNNLDEVVLFDLSGRFVSKGFKNLDLNDFSEGLYLLFLRSGKTIATGKIFVSN
jgi:hypothetical protein